MLFLQLNGNNLDKKPCRNLPCNTYLEMGMVAMVSNITMLIKRGKQQNFTSSALINELCTKLALLPPTLLIRFTIF